MQSANLDIKFYAVRAWYIIDGAIRYTLYIYDTDCIRLKLYLGDVMYVNAMPVLGMTGN